MKDKVYRIQDFTKNDYVDESRFNESKTRNGNPRLECNVIIMYEDEYDTIIQENTSLKQTLQKLESTIKKE